LNLRSEPILKPSTIRTNLPFGHPVDVTGDAAKPGWKTVTATYQVSIFQVLCLVHCFGSLSALPKKSCLHQAR
jgi:hypothetical protein